MLGIENKMNFHYNTNPDGAVGLLTAVTVARFDDVCSRISIRGFLQDQTVEIPFNLDVGSP